MNVYEERLKRYIQESGVEAVHLTFDASCHSVADAAKAVGAPETSFVKNVCMVAEDTFIVAIVKGEHRASTSRVAKALGVERPRVAEPEEVLERIGYPVGGVPSFGYDAVFVVDEKVMDEDDVYSGGGSPNALVRISPTALVAENGAMVARVRK